jgi:hypothetical protein
LEYNFNVIGILENILKMKKLLSVVAFILMMDNILTPFSVLGDEIYDFGVDENITVESEVEQVDLSDDIVE